MIEGVKIKELKFVFPSGAEIAMSHLETDDDAEKYRGLQLSAAMIDEATQISEDPQIRFAALLSSLLPDQIKNLCEKYRVPSDYKELALMAGTYRSLKIEQLQAGEILRILMAMDAFRREKRFQKYLLVSSLFHRTEFLEKSYEAAKNITADEKMRAGLNGKEIAEKLQQLRENAIANLLAKMS